MFDKHHHVFLLDVIIYVTAHQMTDKHLQMELSDFAVTFIQLAECFNTSSAYVLLVKCFD